MATNPSSLFREAVNSVFGQILRVDEEGGSLRDAAAYTDRVFGKAGLDVPVQERPPALRTREEDVPRLALLGKSFSADNGDNACFLNSVAFVLCAFDNTPLLKAIEGAEGGVLGALRDVSTEMRKTSKVELTGEKLWTNIARAVKEDNGNGYEFQTDGYIPGQYCDPETIVERVVKNVGNDALELAALRELTDILQKKVTNTVGTVLYTKNKEDGDAQTLSKRFFVNGEELGHELVLLGFAYSLLPYPHYAAFVRTMASASPGKDRWARFDAQTPSYENFGVDKTVTLEKALAEVRSGNRMVLYFSTLPPPARV